jgi:hypothetical protein
MRAIGNVLFGREWLVAAVLLLLAINSALSDQFDHLTPRFSGTSANLNSIAYGTNVYVAVGAGGLVLKSPDSAAWSNQISPTTNELRGVAFANGQFVAVGGSGTIITSPDGISWTAQTSGVTNRLNAVASSGGAFVAVGDSGTILYSTNGVNWQSIITGVPYNLNGIAYGIAKYVGGLVIVGDSGVVLSSPDGLGWTVRSSGTFLNLNAIAGYLGGLNAGGGSFIAVGQSGVIDTSPDGVTWTVGYSGVTANLHGIAFDLGGNWGVTGDGGIFLISSSGINGSAWTTQGSETTNDLQGIAFGNGGFIAVGKGGSVQAGFVWTRRASGVTGNLSNVVWGANCFIAVGAQGTILSSTNGVNWVLCNSGTTSNFLSVIFANNRFVAVGNGTVAISTNGLDWTSTISSNNFIRLAYGNGIYVALVKLQDVVILGQPTGMVIDGVLISSDAINWASPSPGLNFELHNNYDGPGLTFGNNLFVVTEASGAIDTSSDGVHWARQSQNSDPNDLGPVNYCNGLFVAGAGGLLTSTNGTTWNSIGTIPAYYWSGPCFGNGEFVVAENLAYVTSFDGVTWIIRGSHSGFETSPPLNSITFGAGTFVAVGAGGVIVQSVPTPSLVGASPVSQGIKINATGDIGRNFVLETTTNLSAASWTTLFSVTNAPYSTNFIDFMTNVPQRFYRSHEQ